ncbi:PREDICTED: uncharacterized protein LOC104599545 isoform X2 [Nelumbo nucifera]|uniref:Uncharacterized protein LOC104599545 isoform X2 n=2 Tax=Nelumbo nucifera TaxID=4432 RepID=A0A1U8A0L2_NELNU|nr:PREDICTED: uncharacterized protein LOC104599545 isoform X2 [Nelumbo nucifera]DAD22704.1 TPA_asm: hypothetical protein HUJ06_024167 [Nelumbo nucifera]
MAESLEDFQPMFGKAKAEWENPCSFPLLLFMFHVHALDAFNLRVHVTDFHSYTWEATRSVVELEELRDNIGIGGSWSDFVDYLIASIKSDNVKLVLSASPTPAGDKEQEHAYQLSQTLSAEEEKNESIQCQLDALLSSKRKKPQNSNLSDKAPFVFDRLNNSDVISVSETHDSPEKPSSQDPLSTKVSQRVVPAYRRAKVRGVLLQDTEGSEDN